MSLGTVSLPGAAGHTISLSYDNPKNLRIAQAIANALQKFEAAGHLNVQNYAGSATPSIQGGAANELVIQPGQSFVSVPHGYTYVVDGTDGRNFAAVGVANFAGGDGNLYVQTVALPGTLERITAGNGRDYFNLAQGSHYHAGLGDGRDSVVAGGAGTIGLGSGDDLVVTYTGSDTIQAGSGGNITETKFSGHIDFLGAPNVAATINSATGGDTVRGAADNDITYTGAGRAILSAGGGSETISSAQSVGNETLFGSQSAGSDDLLIAGRSHSVFVAGSGNDTLVGNAQAHETFVFINHAAGGDTDIANATQSSKLVLQGYDTLYGGAAGSDKAAHVVSEQITAGVNSSAGGPVSVTLADHTVITFEQLGHGLHVTSS